MSRASKTFEPDGTEVIAARRFVGEALDRWGCPSEDARLLVSELATNAVIHARSEFTVTVDADRRRIRVEVADGNSRMPHLATVPSDAYSGRGLLLVQAISTSWGVDAGAGDGKTIWFELDR